MTDIEILERAENYVGVHYVNGVEDAYINPCLLRAIDKAIAALRAQQETEKNEPLTLDELREMTNADRIRAMSDEELAEWIDNCTNKNGPHFCQKRPECYADLESNTLIPLERCKRCLLDWLQQPAEEG